MIDEGASEREGRPPLFQALAAQAVGAVLAFGFWFAMQSLAGVDVPLLPILVLQGGAAAAVGVLFRLATWWMPIQALLPPAVWWAKDWGVPAWVWLVLAAGLGLVYWNSARGQVPLYLSNRKTRDAVAALVPDGPVKVLDLGCGPAGTILGIARARPDAECVGIESAPPLALFAWIRRSIGGPANATIRFGDFWDLDLRPFDVVYAFLSPVPMARLFAKARAEMRPGTVFVSNSFEVPGEESHQTVTLDDRRRTRLLIWRMSEGTERRPAP